MDAYLAAGAIKPKPAQRAPTEMLKKVVVMARPSSGQPAPRASDALDPQPLVQLGRSARRWHSRVRYSELRCSVRSAAVEDLREVGRRGIAHGERRQVPAPLDHAENRRV